MARTTVSQIVLSVMGLPVLHVRSWDYTVNTGRELAQGMSPTGEPLGHSNGTKTYELEVELYIPVTGDIAWEDIENAVISSRDRDGVAFLPVFSGVFTKRVGSSFKEKGHAVRRISMGATKKFGND